MTDELHAPVINMKHMNTQLNDEYNDSSYSNDSESSTKTQASEIPEMQEKAPQAAQQLTTNPKQNDKNG